MQNNVKKDRMRKFLIECAIKGTTPNYRELAFNSGFRWSPEDDYGPDFLPTLMEIGKEDVEAGRPPLNVLVRNGKFPGKGFYNWYVEMFPKTKKKEIVNNEAFDRELRERSSEYWRHSAEGLAS